MSEKRYIVDVDEAIIDTKINREYTTWDISGVEDICDKLNNLTEENEQLKQRNTNQYNQLNKLWGLIQAKDWETLSAMDNQMKEDEERLQREWKCYE